MSQQTTPPRRRRTVSNAAEGQVVATSQTKVSGQVVDEKEQTKSFPVDGLPEHPAEVRIAAGVTRSLGNYEFIRVDASVTLPCGTTDAEIRAAKQRASDLVVDFIEEEYQKAAGIEGRTD